MNTTLTVGQVGKQLGLPTKTIRFYEEIGLVAPAKRAENGYRLYTPQDIEQLTLIKHARDLGLPIAQIKNLLKSCETGCEHSTEVIVKNVSEYLTVVEEKIKQLQNLKIRLAAMKSKIDTRCIHDQESKYCCQLLKQFLELSKGGDNL